MAERSGEREEVVLVDEQGRALGVGDRAACHRGAGALHAAFLVMIFDDGGKLLLARRSRHKALWPGYWDGTVAGHYRPDEDRPAGVRARVQEELGVRCDGIRPLFRFLYRAAYRDAGSEYELCDVYEARGIDAGRIAPDPKEVSGRISLSLEELAGGAKIPRDDWTPWLRIALENYVPPL